VLLDPQLYALFLAAALLLTLAPGPDTMFVLGASLGGGARGGLLAAAGIMTGLLVHLALAVVGVSALIAASPLAFDMLRWAGAAYLVWIGVPLLVRAVRERSDTPASAPEPIAARLYWQGLATDLLNPKIVVFYVAFLPQFVAPGLGHAPLQLLLLGMSHWLMGLPYLSAVALASGAMAGWLRRSPGIRRGLDVVAGMVFVGLALRLVLAQRKPA
jgi:threonine/homoserine/homoserine lactone efflux protein